MSWFNLQSGKTKYLPYWTAGSEWLNVELPAVITSDPGARDEARVRYVIDRDGVSTGTYVV